MNNLIAATEIDAWAKLNPRRAQELLPELIVRLILCTSSIKYREDASKLHISYPHTAAILEKLAECYWQESLYEQKRELLDFRG